MKRLHYLFLAVMALVLASCEHKELCYHHPHTVTIRVEFDWKGRSAGRP